MVFIFFSTVFCVYILALLVALFFEYPFRSLVKIVICPPRKILKLKKDLANRLQTSNEDLFEDDIEENEEEVEKEEGEKEEENVRSFGGSKSNRNSKRD